MKKLRSILKADDSNARSRDFTSRSISVILKRNKKELSKILLSNEPKWEIYPHLKPFETVDERSNWMIMSVDAF